MDKKLLIIRFSSFGDIIHCRGQLGILEEKGSFNQIDWLVRDDLKGALEGETKLDRIVSFKRTEGLGGLISLALKMRNQYDVVYDAHNNLRSVIFRFFLCFLSSSQLIIRPKNRWKRFLLFKMGINKFPWPFRAMDSYWKPMSEALKIEGELKPREWKVDPPLETREILKKRIVLVPATAWKMKSWPVEHWKRLIELLPNQKFILLGGPADTFCEEIQSVAPERVENWAGKYSLKESCAIAAHSDFLISADTGLQQVADLAGVKGLSLIGPSAFGFTTMGTMKTVSVDLPCRPCTKDGRGKCSREIYQECMVKITPEDIAKRCQVEFG
ncbi:MAG: glycosyltransferase family 9 protein, partial [Halobacteriovoraceae bacterium]|nr:glycosyltransferase family 9 protein [Halobacteriovoraceae bacterium]